VEHLRDAVANGSIDRFYVHSPDRLARKYAYQVLLVDEWQRADIEIVFLIVIGGGVRAINRAFDQ
jgi:site-specific DNA recombinase